ncbi:TetR/AcrR family transcriptional regulator [Halocatena salina]|uniref:TetR/AcrR family transcriptional regulator n=1 Tax=Halocatena salina TaxID=2934340 RepID=A0A8U0A5N6_9EURY|nr:TetR/AcrR family transcriptional regulator [Halocatena salina]UPM44500.1 TetR/AcrR family transcriptional regulator [Halocatena salina]
MPTFTEEKRERVREALCDTGRGLLGRYGIRKTSISELTEAVGIGKGTFYQFYDSKEELYVDILAQYREEAVPRLLNIRGAR